VRERLFSSPDFLGRLGCKMPGVANRFLESSVLRYFGSRFLGITSRRALPRYATQRFDRWFARRVEPGNSSRGPVILWDDTFVRYHEPQIGIAAVKVLEAAGFEVMLERNRQCCGRPAFSQGNLAEASRLGKHNLALLSRQTENTPILFLEPSCYSMFVEDYRELKLPDSERIAERCFLFPEFVEELLNREPDALKFDSVPEKVVVHVHCHVKSRNAGAVMKRLAERLPKRAVEILETGCCGMAGGFGMMESKYELSVKIAEPLIREIRNQPFGTIFVTSGASCRSQALHLTPVKSRHISELLAGALVD
jgi:Fe-S oxidoreductase